MHDWKTLVMFRDFLTSIKFSLVAKNLDPPAQIFWRYTVFSDPRHWSSIDTFLSIWRWLTDFSFPYCFLACDALCDVFERLNSFPWWEFCSAVCKRTLYKGQFTFLRICYYGTNHLDKNFSPPKSCKFSRKNTRLVDPSKKIKKPSKRISLNSKISESLATSSLLVKHLDQ